MGVQNGRAKRARETTLDILQSCNPVHIALGFVFRGVFFFPGESGNKNRSPGIPRGITGNKKFEKAPIINPIHTKQPKRRIGDKKSFRWLVNNFDVQEDLATGGSKSQNGHSKAAFTAWNFCNVRIWVFVFVFLWKCLRTISKKGKKKLWFSG